MLQNQQGGQGGANMAGPPTDSPQVDTAEQIYISSLALLKMLKHGELFLAISMFPLHSCRQSARLAAAAVRSRACLMAQPCDSAAAILQAVLACPWR